MQPTKILYLTNNAQALQLFSWLNKKDDLECKLLQGKIKLKTLDDFKPNLLISYGYQYIITSDVIKKYSGRIINLHISLLPWNKGTDPNFWSFLENSPKGVTIHLIDEGIDTGDILFQKRVDFNEEKETLKSSYEKLQLVIQNLFKENWDKIKNLNFIPYKQNSKGSIHYKKDFQKISFLLEEKGWETKILELKENYKKYISQK